MANDAAKADVEKVTATAQKLNKQIETMNTEADEIRKTMQANAKLSDELGKLLKKA